MSIDTYISSEDIAKKVKELGAQITKDFAGEELVVVGVLNGSFLFMADLVREIKVPVYVEFMKASSYGDGTESTGKVDIQLDIKQDISGKNVLVVEDIVDTGLTISGVMNDFTARNPKSLKVCSLLFKPARLKNDVKIDYLAFEIEDKFVIGYGLDYAGKYRELPYIGIYNED
jgi:hypoxanthine phosphoribosyltransferase